MTGLDQADDSIEHGRSTDEYRRGTEGYSSSDEDGDASASPEPWWKRAGYSSLQEYIQEQDRLKVKYELLPKGTPVPAIEMPGAEVGTVVPPAPLENRVRQVNVKLRPSEGQELDQAGRARLGLDRGGL